MRRWFFNYAMNYRTYNIFDTAQYSPDQGYETKKEAVEAAINHANKSIKELASSIEDSAQKLLDITTEKKKLEELL